MLVLISLAVVWAAVLVSYGASRVRADRPASSVVSFRRQLSTLERATPGHSLRLSNTGPVPIVRSVAPTTRDQRKRRRDVLGVLVGSTLITALAAVVVGGVAVGAFFLCAAGLGTYCWALVQLRKRASERAVKVHVLRPRVLASVSPVLALRNTATN